MDLFVVVLGIVFWVCISLVVVLLSTIWQLVFMVRMERLMLSDGGDWHA